MTGERTEIRNVLMIICAKKSRGENAICFEPAEPIHCLQNAFGCPPLLPLLKIDMGHNNCTERRSSMLNDSKAHQDI